jgi:hypothetical protein
MSYLYSLFSPTPISITGDGDISCQFVANEAAWTQYYEEQHRLERHVQTKPLQYFPSKSWTLEEHKYFPVDLQRRVFQLLCCLRRKTIHIPPDITFEILSYFSLHEEISSRVVCITDKTKPGIIQRRTRRTRIFSLKYPIAIDIESERDSDGECKIVADIRKYPHEQGLKKMTVSVNVGGKLVFWKRLRDGSDSSWRITELTVENSLFLQHMLFGDLLMDDQSWLLFMKQF